MEDPFLCLVFGPGNLEMAEEEASLPGAWTLLGTPHELQAPSHPCRTTKAGAVLLLLLLLLAAASTAVMPGVPGAGVPPAPHLCVPPANTALPCKTPPCRMGCALLRLLGVR